MGRRGRRSSWALAMLMAALPCACDTTEEEPSLEELVLRDARAVTHGSSTLDGTPRLAHMGALFVLPPGADPSDPDALRRDAVTQVHDRMTAVFGAIGCEAQLGTDGDRHLSVLLQGCRLLLWSIDAELEAEARATEDGVVWDLDIAELATALLGLPPTRFSGPAELFVPVDAAVPLRWQTFPGFVIETRFGLRFDTLSTASWTVGDDDCIDLELGARLTLEEREDELDERIGDVVLSARGLRRCPGQCAETGQVELSFGQGQVLRWVHDGSDTLTVVAPRGREFEAVLPCADDAGAAGG